MPWARAVARIARACALGTLVATAVQAQDDWALTRPDTPREVAPQGPSQFQVRRAAARALALEGRHAEAAEALQALAVDARTPRALRGSVLREAASEELSAGRVQAALDAIRRARPLATARELAPLEREAHQRAGTLRNLAESYEREHRWSDAAEAWSLAGEPERALASYQRIAVPNAVQLGAMLHTLQALGRANEAEVLARKLVRRNGTDPAPVIALAEALRAQGRREEALSVLAAREHTQSPPLHAALVDLYRRWGEQALAARALERLIALEPARAAHRIALADLLLERGERERAVDALRRAAGSPASARSEARAAELLADRDLLREAIEHAQRARQLAPTELAHLEREASLLERAGRLADAESGYRELLARSESAQTQRTARQHLASLWRRMGSRDAQLGELRARVAGPEPDLDAARLLLEVYGRDPTRTTERRELLARMLARSPNDVDALLALQRLQVEAGDLHAALETAMRVLAQGGELAALHLDSCLELARTAPSDPAWDTLLSRIGDLAADRARVQRELGDLYARRGRSVEARAAYERALALDARDERARLGLAALARLDGDRAQESSILQAVIASGSSEASALEAAAQLAQLDRAESERALSRAYAARGGAGLRRALLASLAISEGTPARAERDLRSLQAPLRAALEQGDSLERATALSLVEAAPWAELGGSLLTLVSEDDALAAQRAAAMRALARLHSRPHAARLSELYARLPRSLRPVALWALATIDEELAAPVIERELRARDADLRAMAALVSSPDQVRALTADPDLRVRAAALWALPRGEAKADQAALADGPVAVRALAIALSEGVHADALFAPEPLLRAQAVRALLAERRRAAPPPPSWPFALDDYLIALADAGWSDDVRSEPEPQAWLAITEAARRALMRPEALAQLLPHGAGIVPRALARACVSVTAVEAFSVGLVGPLRRLYEREPAAAALLVHAAAQRPELLAELVRTADVERKRALLAELSRLQVGSAVLDAQLARERSASDWPTRMWATRALTSGEVRADPVALVRSPAAAARAPQERAWCAHESGRAN